MNFIKKWWVDFRRNTSVKVPLRDDALTKKSIYRFRIVTTGYYVIMMLMGGLFLGCRRIPEIETTPKAIIICIAGALMLLCFICILGSFADNLAERFKVSRDYLDEWEKEIEARAQAFFGRVIMNLICGGWFFLAILYMSRGPDRRSSVEVSLDYSILIAGFTPLIIGLAILPNLYIAWVVKPIDA